MSEDSEQDTRSKKGRKQARWEHTNRGRDADRCNVSTPYNGARLTEVPDTFTVTAPACASVTTAHCTTCAELFVRMLAFAGQSCTEKSEALPGWWSDENSCASFVVVVEVTA